jgi:hypothetical protein
LNSKTDSNFDVAVAVQALLEANLLDELKMIDRDLAPKFPEHLHLQRLLILARLKIEFADVCNYLEKFSGKAASEKEAESLRTQEPVVIGDDGAKPELNRLGIREFETDTQVFI